MKFIMVTDWRDHWDRLPGGATLFTISMLIPPMAPLFLRNDTSTTFLLFSRRVRSPLKAWTGKVTQISHTPGSARIAFRANIRREIRFPHKYARLADGWYVEEPEAAAASTGFW